MQKKDNSKSYPKRFIYSRDDFLSMEKKGQVTIFIIVGIVILIAVGLYFGYSQLVLKDKFQQEIAVQKNVPQQIQPITDYLSSCVQEVSARGINLLGLRGGYIEIPEEKMPKTNFNPLNSYVEIFPNADYKVSVWFRQQPNGIQITNVPQKQDMQNELARYIDTNFVDCVNSLSLFTEQGFSFKIEGSIKSEVEIKDNVVNVRVNLPIEVSKEDFKFSLENYLSQINSRIGEMHSMAVEILNKENADFFLEEKTIDMLVAYDPEIPFSGSSNDCTERIWSKQETIKKFKEVLEGNVAGYRIEGTDYEDVDPKFDYLTFDALSSSHSGISGSFLYSRKWPTVVEINPSKGDILKEDSVNQKAGIAGAIISSYYCLSTHRFVYNIKYPIVVNLVDEDGNMFSFATQVIIDRNKPRENRVAINELPDENNLICNYPQQEIEYEVMSTSPSGDLIDLDYAEVYFKCLPASCAVNGQKISERGGGNRYRALVPKCYNGVLEGRKEGYYSGKTQGVSTNQEINEVIPVILTPIYNKNIKVFVIDKNTGEIREPYKSEQIIIQFSNKNRNTPYTTSLIYPGDENIELIAGEYNINSIVIGNSSWPIVSPKREIQHCTKAENILGFATDEKCFTTTIPETEIDSAIKGGANFDFIFDEADLSRAGDLVIYTMASPIPTTAEEMAKIYEEIDLNKDDARFKYPEI